MRRFAFLLRPSWLALFVVVLAFAYLCFTVLAPWQLGKNSKTSRENDQISHSVTADPVSVTTLLPQQDSAAPNDQWRQVTATGKYLPDAQVAGPVEVGRWRARLRGAGALRGRRRSDGARRPRLRTPGGRLESARDTRNADGFGDRDRPTAGFRGRRCRQGAVPSGRHPTGLLDQHRSDRRGDRRAAGRVLPAVGRGSARRTRRHRAAPPRRRAVPVLRHPVDRVRHHRADRPGLLHTRRDPCAPTGKIRRSRPRTRHPMHPSRRRRSSPTATAGAAESHGHDRGRQLHRTR